MKFKKYIKTLSYDNLEDMFKDFLVLREGGLHADVSLFNDKHGGKLEVYVNEYADDTLGE